jgi:hypothetical protein
MDKKIEQLKMEIANTKADLKEKTGEFENRLREDVTNAKGAVEGAIHSVQSVAEGLSLKKLVQKRPLLMVGGSVVTGMVAGVILAPNRPVSRSIPSEQRPSVARRVNDRFPNEVQLLKTMAFTHLVSFMARKAKTAFPDFVQKITEFEQQIASTLGNKS